MNSEINSQNINIVNTIKELLWEINNDNDNEDEKDDKDNDEYELDNSKINSNLNSSQAKLSESSVKFLNFKLILSLKIMKKNIIIIGITFKIWKSKPIYFLMKDWKEEKYYVTKNVLKI